MVCRQLINQPDDKLRFFSLGSQKPIISKTDIGFDGGKSEKHFGNTQR